MDDSSHYSPIPPPPSPISTGDVTPPIPPPVARANPNIVVSSGGRKKWGTGALVGSLMAIVVLVVGAVFFGPKLLQRQTNKPSLADSSSCLTLLSNTFITAYKCPGNVTTGCQQNPTTYNLDNSSIGADICFDPNYCGTQQIDRAGAVGGQIWTYMCNTPPPPDETTPPTVNCEGCACGPGGNRTSCVPNSVCGDQMACCDTRPECVSEPVPPSTPVPGCTLNPRILFSTNGINFSDASGTTITLPFGTTSVYYKGINGSTGSLSPNVTARVVWNNDTYKGAVCVNQVCTQAIPFPANTWPTRFEAFENEVGRTSDPYDIQVQLYFNETTCVNRGGVILSTTPLPSPTPTPTPTPVPSFQCQQVVVQSIARGGQAVASPTLDKIQAGDVVTFRGFATAANTTVSAITFTLIKGGVVQTPVDKPATLVSGQYQADYTITIDTATSYSVTSVPVSP